MLRRFFRNEPRAHPRRSPDDSRGSKDAGRTRRASATTPEQGAADPEASQGTREARGDPGAELEQALAEASAAADVEALIDVALRARGSIRHAALEHPRMQEASALATLEKRARHRDKSLNRHARRLLDECRRLRGEAESAAQRASELAEALTPGRARNETAPDAAMERAERERRHELHRRLHETLDRHAGLRTALLPFGDQLADLEHLRPDDADLPELDPATPMQPAGQAAPPAEPAAQEVFEPLVAAFRELDRRMSEGADFEAVAADRQRLTEQWLTSADHEPPNATQHEVFEAVSHRFRELADAAGRLAAADLPDLPEQPLIIEPGHPDHDRQAAWQAIDAHRNLLQRLTRIRRHVRWPEWAAPNPALQRLDAGIATLQQEIEVADAALATELESLDTELSALGSAIDEGHLGQAQSLLSQARHHLDALPAGATRQAGRQVGKQAARLAELKDWQTFATTPKREQLVSAMQALAETPLPAPEQADRIKALRAEWQGLGPVTQATDGRLADRFNALAEQAFEPCRAYFAELAETRKHNLAERRRICDQLEQYLSDTDWRHTDMKAAERIMRAARDEWRRYHPVDRGPGRKIEARFEKLQASLHEQVKAEWDRNLAAKSAIVAEAEALLAGDLPPHQKVAAAKDLQRRWRAVGITPRRPDQQLWRAFRGACDGIFAARDEARHAADRARDAEAEAIGAELDRFETALSKPDALPDRAQARALGKRTAALDGLPPGQRRQLEQRRRALLQRHEQLLAQQARLRQRAELAALRGWDERLAAAEQQGSVDAAAAADAAVPEAVQRARLAAATSGAAAPLQALRRLTVRAELAASVPSPAEDEPLRLELQVERLQAGLGGAGGAQADDVASLAEAWCGLGPKDGAAEPLRARFFGALERLCADA